MRWLLLLAACGTPAPPPEGTSLHAWVSDVTDVGGVLSLQLEVPHGATWQVSEPAAHGLTFHPRRDPRLEQVGASDVVLWQWRFGGYQGTYEIGAMTVDYSTDDGPGTLTSEPIWVDLGVAPPRPSEIVDIEDPSRIWRPSPGLVGLVGGVGLLLAGALTVAVRMSRQQPPPPPPVPPWVWVIRRWARAPNDGSLDDLGRAQALSDLFREYVEATLRFGATAATTSEILDHLGRLGGLPDGNVPRAKRLLRATDRIKFADAAAAADLFIELDADLRAFVDSTRPRSWQEPA